MLDLPGHPTLDKQALIGACSRLPLSINAARLQSEIAALPEISTEKRLPTITLNSPEPLPESQRSCTIRPSAR